MARKEIETKKEERGCGERKRGEKEKKGERTKELETEKQE
jgi:hypothetical protein